METDDGSGDNQLLLASLKTRLYVMYVPADGKEKNVPERHKLLQAIVAHGGQLLSRKDAQLPENAGKFMALAVNRSAMPRGTLPVPAGTAVYDGTWVFDCIREATLLPTDNYLLVPGGQAGGAQEAPKAAAPTLGARASPLPPASLGNDNQAEQGGAGGERATPKKKRSAYTMEDDRKLRDWVDTFPAAKVKGHHMWLQAEKAGLLPGRTWQSMRERYSKYLLDGAAKSPATAGRLGTAAQPVASPPKAGGAASLPEGHKPAALPNRQRATKRARPVDEQPDGAAEHEDMMVDSSAIRKRLRVTSERHGCQREEVLHALMVSSGVWRAAEDFLRMPFKERDLTVACSWTAANDEALKVVANTRASGKAVGNMKELQQLKGFNADQVYDRTRFLGLVPLRL